MAAAVLRLRSIRYRSGTRWLPLTPRWVADRRPLGTPCLDTAVLQGFSGTPSGTRKCKQLRSCPSLSLCTSHTARSLWVIPGGYPQVLYVTYLRLSRENRNGRNYGLEAQRRDLDLFLNDCCPDDNGCTEIATYVEIQSGADDARPQLAAAIAHAKKEGATLLVAKLDRLSRRVSFIAGLLEDKRLSFRVACMPMADKFQLHIYAALAEQEREFISARTKAGLGAAKARGVKLGGLRPGTIKTNEAARAKAAAEAEQLRPVLAALQSQGATLRQMSEALAGAGRKTRNGQPLSPTQVKRLLQRLGLA